MHTWKIHLHVDQFSLKQPEVSRKALLQPRLKKYPHGLGRKGKEAVGSEPAQQERSQKRRRLYRFRDPPWGARGSSHILGTPSLTSSTGKVTPLGSFEIQWGLQEGCRKPRLRLWRAHACSLLKQGAGSRLKLPGALACFPRPPVCAPWVCKPLPCPSHAGAAPC